jgi:hypothetical protein
VAFLAVVRFLVAAPFLAADDRLAVVRFLVVAAFLAADFRLAGDLPVRDLFVAGMGFHPLPNVRTPYASGVSAPVRSCRPIPRTARRDAGHS